VPTSALRALDEKTNSLNNHKGQLEERIRGFEEACGIQEYPIDTKIVEFIIMLNKNTVLASRDSSRARHEN
jgi:hypothetical protein